MSHAMTGKAGAKPLGSRTRPRLRVRMIPRSTFDAWPPVPAVPPALAQFVAGLRAPSPPTTAPLSPLARLLQVAELHLDGLTQRAAWRLARFTVIPLLGTAGSRASAWAEDHGGGGQKSPSAHTPSLWDSDPRTALHELRRHARKQIELLRVHREVPIDQRMGALEWRGDGRTVLRLTGSARQRFDAALAVALLRESDRLCQCPGVRCTRLFVKARTQQRYCTPSCNNRTRQAKYARVHPTGRRERYEARIRWRFPRAKIGSRPRRPAKGPSA